MTSPGAAIPWWHSRAMVGAYAGLAIAITDALSAWAMAEELSWRTLVLFLVSALAGWGRKAARTIVFGWFFGPVTVDEDGDVPR